MALNNSEKLYHSDASSNTSEEYQYHRAVKQVGNIKGFYKHLVVFIAVNIFFVIVKLLKANPNESVWEVLYVTFFWGIGLLFHGLKVFGWFTFLGRNWEEKKIKEILEQEKKNQK